jgi:hypothetical protein
LGRVYLEGEEGKVRDKDKSREGGERVKAEGDE